MAAPGGGDGSPPPLPGGGSPGAGEALVQGDPLGAGVPRGGGTLGACGAEGGVVLRGGLGAEGAEGGTSRRRRAGSRLAGDVESQGVLRERPVGAAAAAAAAAAAGAAATPLRGCAWRDGLAQAGVGAGSEPLARGRRLPLRRSCPPRPREASAGEQGFYARHVPQEVKGLYLVKFAVSLAASYLGIQLLSTFAEVLLPFIFAVLCMMILDPLKVFIMRVLQRLAVKAFDALGLKACLELSGVPGRPQGSLEGTAMTANLYGRLSQDSPPEDSPSAQNAEQVAEPAPFVKKALLAISILLCILFTGRSLWLTARVFVRAGVTISNNIKFYQEGADRLKRWFRTYIHSMHIEALDYNKLLDGLVAEVQDIGTIVTESVLYAALQAIVTFIFLIYMLWSPIKMESSTLSKDAFESTARYMKVKCLISALTGFSVAITLWASGLDLPAAFGLLAFLANFLPGIGSPVAAALPCILAIIDVRKTPTQVCLAFACQACVHFCVDFLVEPVFFGISVEIHSVIVILGIWFFYQVWGVPGMLLSVPLLAVARIMMKSLKHAATASGSFGGPAEERDTIVLLDSILEGRWMSTVGSPSGAQEQELELPELAAPLPGELARPDRGGRGRAPSGEGPEADWWAPALESRALQDTVRLYRDNRLVADCALLVVLVCLIIFAPL